MGPMESYHYVFGPLVAFVALLVVLLLCRWVFTPSRPRRGRPDPALPRDYGLLVPVATTPTLSSAAELTAVLRREGIRGTVAAAPATAEGVRGAQVLVFRDDADRARELVTG